MDPKVRAMFGGRVVQAQPTGNNDKGNPYTGVGYREATISRGKKTIYGRLTYHSGGWQFEPFGEPK